MSSAIYISEKTDIFVKIIDGCKPITSRVRFREMVAYSNGFLNSNMPITNN